MPIDYSKYPENWLTEIRPTILTRDNNQCKHCDVKNHAIIKRHDFGGYRYLFSGEYSHISELVRRGYNRTQAIKKLGFTKIVLTIAHLNQDITDNSDLNLAALCQRCHLKHDREFNKNLKLQKQLQNQLKLAL